MVFDRSLSQEGFSAYAAGTLEPALQLLVETRAALKPSLSLRLAAADAVVGALFEGEAPAPLSDNAIDRAMAAIDSLSEAPSARHQIAAKAANSAIQELIELPEPLRSRVLEAAGETSWRFAGPGLRVLPVAVSSSSHVELLRIEPGCGAPRHSHLGTEYTLVLQGRFCDESGSYGPGDVAVVGPGHTHRPMAEGHEVCLALAVREGGLEFKGGLGLIQRLFAN